MSSSTSSSVRALRREFPALGVDRLPPSIPGVTAGSVPGYELRALIGTGELGEVHRAYQTAVGREVAVRIFGPWMVGHPQFVRRFESGSQRIARVDHPHVLPLLDYWREPSRAVMVSRLVRGGDLRPIASPTDGMDPVTALAVIEKVAAGISVAHRLGVVHGRLRPENILFDDADNPYVADLGIDEICTGIVSFATHAYDAPERLGGALATPAPDIYSLGLLVHEVLGGSSAAAGRSPVRRAETPSTPSSPGRPILTRTAAMVRSTSSSTSCARRWPSRSRRLGAVRADAQPVPGSGAVRGGRRRATSTVATRSIAEMVDVLAAGTADGRLRSIGHRQVVGGQGRARPRAATRGRRWLGVLARHRDDTWQRSVRAAAHGAGPCRRRRPCPTSWTS